MYSTAILSQLNLFLRTLMRILRFLRTLMRILHKKKGTRGPSHTTKAGFFEQIIWNWDRSCMPHLLVISKTFTYMIHNKKVVIIFISINALF